MTTAGLHSIYRLHFHRLRLLPNVTCSPLHLPYSLYSRNRTGVRFFSDELWHTFSHPFQSPPLGYGFIWVDAAPALKTIEQYVGFEGNSRIQLSVFEYQYTQHLVRMLQIIVDGNCHMAVLLVASIHFKSICGQANLVAPFYVLKLNQLQKSSPITPEESILTIADIFNRHNEDNKQTRFTCKASVTVIIPNRKWYYVNCPHCPKKLFLQKGEIPKFECEDDDTIAEPTLMYCVNATVADKTMDTKAVFFNEAMTEMVDISCRNMVVHHGHTDPLIVPPQIHTLRGKPMTFHITVKKDNKMTINRVTKAPTFTPTTPSKRKSQHPPVPKTPSKQPKT